MNLLTLLSYFKLNPKESIYSQSLMFDLRQPQSEFLYQHGGSTQLHVCDKAGLYLVS